MSRFLADPYPHTDVDEAFRCLEQITYWIKAIKTPASRDHFNFATGNSVPRRVCISESTPIGLDWFFDAVSRSENETLSVSELSLYIKGLNAIIHEERYTMLEKILINSVKLGAPSRILLTFSRAAYPVRTRIIGWRAFLNKVAEKLDSNGKDSGRLLKGMI